MIRVSLAVTAAALSVTIAAPLAGQTQSYPSALHDYRVVTVAEGFQNPWSIAFIPGGDILVTEKAGRLRIVRRGQLLPNPVEGVPEVLAQGQGGLLDVVPHPDFETNRLLYLSYSKPIGDGSSATTAVARGRFENDRLTDVEDIWIAESTGRGHYGSRIVFDGNGYMFVSVGDRQSPPRGDLEAHPAQDLSNNSGTINRLHDDGRIPADNPFVNEPNARGEIWSYGHRNPQGLALHPETGELWSTEHGPQGGDEFNLIKRGANYGWPVIGYGVNYGRTGEAIHSSTGRPGMEQPAHFWVPSIGTSGLIIYNGDRFPEWRGDAFAGGMVGQQLARLTIDDESVVSRETIVRRMGRIRDVREGPDGYIYLAIDSRGAERTAILRLEPAGGSDR